jgi:hypothetical protein
MMTGKGVEGLVVLKTGSKTRLYLMYQAPLAALPKSVQRKLAATEKKKASRKPRRTA